MNKYSHKNYLLLNILLLIIVIVIVIVIVNNCYSNNKLYFGDMINKISTEVDYCLELIESNDIIIYKEHLIALSAMQYTEFNVSPALYCVLQENDSEEIQKRSLYEILYTQSGLCGDMSVVFANIIKEFDIKYRIIQFYYSNTHVAVEIYYNGGWHYYDPTWGIYFLKDSKILSIEEIVSIDNRQEYIIHNETLLWNRVTNLIYGSIPLLDMFEENNLRWEYLNY